jgi:hypothetical protein
VRWGRLVAVVVVLASLAAIALLVVRPARVIGVNGDALQTSLEGELPTAGSSPAKARCTEASRGAAWRCDELSHSISYEVRVDDWGCWHGEHVGGLLSGPAPQRVSGCIWLLDFLD